MIRSYLYGLAANYANQFISALVNLVLIPYLLNRLGSELTGVYLVLMTVANFVAVGIGWLASAGVRSIATLSTPDDRSTVDSVYRVIVLGFTIYSTAVLFVMIGVSFLTGVWWLRDQSPETIDQARRACVLLGVYIWIAYVHNADLALLTALFRQGEANLYRVATQIMFAGVAIVSLMYRPQVDVLMGAQVLAVLTVSIGVRVSLRLRNVIGPWKWSLPDRPMLRQVLVTTGGGYFLFGVAQFVLMYADIFIVGAVLGSGAVTAYVVVWRIAEFSGLLLSRVSEMLSPYLTRIEARGDSADLRTLFLATSRFQHVLAIAAGWGYAFLGPMLVALWVGPAHRPASWWLYALSGAGLVFQVINRHDVILHFAMGRVGRLVLPHLLEVSAKLALTYALFPVFGFGAPLAAFAAIQLLGMTWWYRRAALQLLNVSWSQWWREVGDTASLELGLVVAALLAVAPWAMGWPWAETILAAGLLGAVLCLMVRWHWRSGPRVSFASVAGLLSKY